MTTDEILDTVTGYADGFQRVMTATGMEAPTLTDLLLDHNVEQCPNCKWHTDSFHLLDGNSVADGYCDNCRKYDKPSQD